MDPQVLRGGFRIAILITGLSLAIFPFEPAGSAESVVTLLAAIVGGTFLVAVVLLARLVTPPMPNDKGRRKIYNGRSIRRGR